MGTALDLVVGSASWLYRVFSAWSVVRDVKNLPSMELKSLKVLEISRHDMIDRDRGRGL